MQPVAVVLEAPERLELRPVTLVPAGADDLVVDIEWSGISTGTEKLLWTGTMPHFPGMGYPLVPGYESIGRVVETGHGVSVAHGTRVFVPGASCFGDVRGLFGGAASRLVVPANRAVPVPESLGERGILLALAATALHAMSTPHAALPELIVGHGVLGRLLARLTVAFGGNPVVWEQDPVRRTGAEDYMVIAPEDDDRTDYAAIYDVSGAADLLDTLIARIAPGGEVVLAGFYAAPLTFTFPPAFMREARIRVSAEWRRGDLDTVTTLIADDRLSLDGLISHVAPADEAEAAYRTAFNDPACLKMILSWRDAP